MKNIFKRKRPAETLAVVIHPVSENRRDFVMNPGDTMHIPVGDKVWFAEWHPHDEPILQMQVFDLDKLTKHMENINERRAAESILDIEAKSKNENKQ